MNDAFILVDLPGYGYARVSKEKRAEWKPLIEGFMRYSPQLRGIVQLLDARHDPTTDDRQMLDFLSEIGVPTIVVLTKIDKLTAKQRTRAGLLDRSRFGARRGAGDSVQRRDR